MPVTDHQIWEDQAKWWQDTFTDGADEEYTEQILPLAMEHLAGAKSIIDVGAGEGQVARMAIERGAREVVAVDRSAGQIEVAKERAGGVHLVRADAGQLPFADNSFEAAIAVLVLEHIEDIESVVKEAARVLQPGGRFLCFLNHPLLQTPGSGWIDDHILEEQYWRIGPYLTEDTTMEEVEAGVILPFVHRPLSAYLNLLSANGLYLTQMVEPAPPAGFLARADEYLEAATIPRLLLLRTELLAR